MTTMRNDFKQQKIESDHERVLQTEIGHMQKETQPS